MTLSSPASALNRRSFADDASFMGEETHPIAGLVCMFGVFLRIVMSDPVLAMFGLDLNAIQEGGNLLEKIHPGVYFILLSLFILLFDHKMPMRQAVRTFRHYTVYSSFLLLYVLLFIYWALRGPNGVGMLIETHMTVPIAAIVLSYTPRSYCRRGLNFFIFITLINSLIGIGESITKTRIFTFDPSWVVLKEEQFRASALLGHPLNNASVTCIAVLIAMAMDYSRAKKALFAAIYLSSLVAFGGRSSLILSIVSLVVIGIASIRQQAKEMTLIKLFFIIAAVIVIPVAVTGWFLILLNTGMGERLMAFSSFNDNSAEARWLVFHVFDYLKPDELLFGVPADRIGDLAHRIGLVMPLSDIENPWLLMFMLLGGIMFCFWLPMTFIFAWRLMKDQPFGLRVAVVAYYITTSTSNSFGRKDSVYTIMAASVICASRALEMRKVQNKVTAHMSNATLIRQDIHLHPDVPRKRL